jgi:hypothetical protein
LSPKTDNRQPNTVLCLLFTVFTLLLLAPRAEAAPAQMKITFGGYTNRSEVLSNFPVLVVFSNNVGGSGFGFSNFVTTSGYDLRFATSSTSTNWLNYEIESWDTNSASYVWVQVPLITSDGTTTIYAKWGSSDNSTQLPCTTNGATWTNGYAGVWHLADTSALESTTNHYTSTRSSLTSSAGIVGSALNFNGTSSLINMGDIINPNSLTLTVWTKWNNTLGSTYAIPVGKASGSTGYELAIEKSNSKLWWANTKNWDINYTTFLMPANGWAHLCMIYDQTVGTRILANAQSVGTDSNTGALGASGILGIGGRGDSQWFYGGDLDEVRLSSVARSTNWVWAEYLTMVSNTVFNNYGAVAAGNIITVGSTSNGFPHTYVNTTSTWSYTISGQLLTNNLTVSVPSPSVFTISSNNVDYGSEVILTTNEFGSVPLTNIWVRFIPTDAVFYSEFITNSSPGADTKTVQVTGLGLAANIPVLTVTPSALGFGNVITNKTSTNMFTVTGVNLTNNVTVSAPPECFWLSTNGADFTQSPVVLATNGSGGTYLTNIYLRFTPTNGQAYGGSITNSSAGAVENKTVPVSGIGVVQSLYVSVGTLACGNVALGASSTNSFTVWGANLEDNVTVTAPSAEFTVSTNTTGSFGSSCTVLVAGTSAPSGANLASTTVHVKFTPSAEGAYLTNITCSSIGAVSTNKAVSGTGFVPRLYITGGTLDFGSVVTGKFSWIPTSYTVSGSNLSASVTVTASAGFQVSTNSGSGFGSSLTLNQSGGTLALTTVYVRFLPTLVQSYAGASITNSSSGAASALQAVTGTGVGYGSKVSTGGDTIYVRTDAGVDYCVHVFTNTGTFTPKVPLANVQYLVIGGGGGGGAGTSDGSKAGGGGGAGGFLTGTVSIASSASITVGGGGAGGATQGSGNPGSQGSNSILAVSGGPTIAADGGGYGGAATTAGNSGGCGGGSPSALTGGTGSQGSKGGNGESSGYLRASGGGGGAGQAGSPGSAVNGGKGGDGASSSITGSSVTYAGGGGGNNYDITITDVPGGAGGGGTAAGNDAGGHATYYGSGGGGAGHMNAGGNGYRGMVILRYAMPGPVGTVLLFR